MLAALRKYRSLDRRRRTRFRQAYFQLGATWLALRRRSFRSLICDLTIHPGFFRSPAPEESVLALAHSIGWAVSAAAGRTPWSSTCLVQVLAAQRMLQQRGIPGAFYIGAAPGASADAPGMEAHAWLQCGDRFITGESGHGRYTVVSTFSWPGR